MKKWFIVFVLLALLTAAAAFRPSILHATGKDFEVIQPSCESWCNAHRYHVGDALIDADCDCGDPEGLEIFLPFIGTTEDASCDYPICFP